MLHEYIHIYDIYIYTYIYICTDSPFVGLLVPTLEPMGKLLIPSLQLGQPK